ncbi:MAG: plasmid mobilization relaxosome protein MobC [Lachnospiraceae bacterium]|nr:plasmid mobilization relaxosome protein MobC [Lachnospiraceae bacterium]
MQKKRTVQKHFELSPYEAKLLKELVAKTGSRKECDVIRNLIMGVELVQSPGPEFYSAIREIRKIGVNINQIAHVANSTGVIDTTYLNDMVDKLDTIASDLKRIVLEPKKERDIKTIVKEMEWMLWETEEDQRKCWRLQDELAELIRKSEEGL